MNEIRKYLDSFTRNHLQPLYNKKYVVFIPISGRIAFKAAVII